MLVGRVKDSIPRRGENVSAAEVEREILAHPTVADAAVIGVAAAVEQEIMAFVVLRPGEPAEPETLITFLEERLPYYAVPRFVEYVDSLPRTISLRVDKQALRDVSSTTWDREAAGIRLRRERL